MSVEPTKKSKRGAPKHNPTGYQLMHDITIPAGTIFREAVENRGGSDAVEAPFGFNMDCRGYFVVQVGQATIDTGYFKRVVA